MDPGQHKCELMATVRIGFRLMYLLVLVAWGMTEPWRLGTSAHGSDEWLGRGGRAESAVGAVVQTADQGAGPLS